MLHPTRWSAPALLALAVLAVAPARAQVPEPGPAPEFGQGCAPGRGCPTLTLAQTLALVAERHPEARAADLERDLGAARLLGARGGFDPLVSSSLAAKTDDLDTKLGLWQTSLSVPIDAPFSPSVDVNHRLGVGPSVNPADRAGDAGETRLGLSFSPLAGRGLDRRRASLAQARLAPETAGAVVAQRRNALLLSAARAYWTWAGAWAAVGVRDSLLDVARTRADFVERRVRAGETAPVDGVEAQLAVVAREGDRVLALRRAEEAGVTLGTFLWEADGAPAPLRAAPAPLPEPGRLPPAVDPAADPAGGALRAAVADALGRRPELVRARLTAETARLEARYARDQTLPDLRVGVQAVSYGDAPASFDDVYVGVQLRQPLWARPARAAIETARVDVARRDIEQAVTARAVEADVAGAAVALRRAAERAAAAAEQTRLARALRRAEVRRFELGEGTLFLVNQRETALAEAQLREVEARADQLQAEATFAWATGVLGG